MGTDIHGVFQRRNGNKWEDIQSKYEQDRHYLLFAWLGNVRNGFGCAGVPTHTEVTPLSDCRGLPDDFAGSNEQDLGDHSFSWVSADEVISTTPPKILRTGIVPRSAFDAWDGTSAPKEWFGGISGPGVVVSDPSSVTDSTSHVRIEWFEDAADTLSYFIDEVKRLKEEHGDVRFVFGFDS